jgi:hypothetical protein
VDEDAAGTRIDDAVRDLTCAGRSAPADSPVREPAAEKEVPTQQQIADSRPCDEVRYLDQHGAVCERRLHGPGELVRNPIVAGGRLADEEPRVRAVGDAIDGPEFRHRPRLLELPVGERFGRGDGDRDRRYEQCE